MIQSDFKTIIVSSGGNINIYEFIDKTYDNFRIISKINANYSCVRDLKIMKNKQLLSCGSDCKIRLWNLMNGKCIRIFNGHVSFIIK